MSMELNSRRACLIYEKSEKIDFAEKIDFFTYMPLNGLIVYKAEALKTHIS